MILNFDKPKKIRSTAEHNEMYVADCAPPGAYVPNMSQEDMCRWKAKHIKGDNERVEIRKTIEGIDNYAQMLVVVYKNHQGKGPEIVMSSNGKMGFSLEIWRELETAIQEAKDILEV